MEKKPFVFWLASWYPTKLDPFPGDFIQRHAKALAFYYPVHVLHIAKDVDGVVTKDIVIEQNTAENLTETIVYYHPRKTGIALFDRLISTYKFLRIGRRLVKEQCCQHETVFIHLHVAMRHGLLALWAKQKLGINYVITEHWTGYDRSTYPERLRPSNWYWAATKRIFRNALFFYPEVSTMGKLINETIAKIPFKPVSNSVDTKLFYPEKNKSVGETFQFIHVSTLSYQKNIEGMLRVIEKCALENMPVHFTLVGPASDDLKEQIMTSPQLSRLITLTGPLPYESVAEQTRKADALIMFSRYENQPCVILEALCCGLPVISTDVGGIAEVINDENGILIKSEDEVGLLNAIKTLLKNYQSFDKEKISSDAQSRYSYESTGKQLLENYKTDLPQYFQ